MLETLWLFDESKPSDKSSQLSGNTYEPLHAVTRQNQRNRTGVVNRVRNPGISDTNGANISKPGVNNP